MFKPGDVIGGRYVVEDLLGEGAMGLVVAARHIELDQVCAIKVVRPEVADKALVERLKREARAAARLKSHHAVTVHDVGMLASGAPYVVMEYLEGVDLKAYLAARKVLPVVEAVDIVLQACEAIGEAHTLGIVHRDLKPANLFVTVAPSGALCIKVVDFGIAKVPEPGGPELTASQVIMGTPLYMAPEQIVSSRKVDGRADIWSLGVVLYKLLTGRVPFSPRESGEIMIAVLTEPPTSPLVHDPTLPADLVKVILRCLEKDPLLRFQSVAELQAALRPLVESKGGPDAQPRSLPRPPDATVLLPQSRIEPLLAPKTAVLGPVSDRTAAPVVRTFLLPGDPAMPKSDVAVPVKKEADDRGRAWPIVWLSLLALLIIVTTLGTARFLAAPGEASKPEVDVAPSGSVHEVGVGGSAPLPTTADLQPTEAPPPTTVEAPTSQRAPAVSDAARSKGADVAKKSTSPKGTTKSPPSPAKSETTVATAPPVPPQPSAAPAPAAPEAKPPVPAPAKTTDPLRVNPIPPTPQPTATKAGAFDERNP